MQLPVQQFPILSPGQMNPFHQALQSGMENYQNNMKTAYMPYAMQAEIGAKQAYANNYGRQMAAQVLSTPGAIASMGNEQVQALLNMMNTSTAGSQRPLVGLPGEGNGPGFFNGMKSFLGGGQQQQGGQPNQGQAGGGANSGMAFNPDGTNQVATDQEINQAGQPVEQPMSVPQYMRQNAQRAVSGDVTTGGGKGVGAGTSYTDPQTGKQYSSLAPSNVGPAQASIMATERVAPYIKTLYDGYDKTALGVKNTGSMVLEGVGSLASSGQTETPHLTALANQKVAVKAGAEGLIKDFQLNATGGNREALEDILKPTPLESVQGYKERLAWLYKNFEERDEAGREALLKGIKLDKKSVFTPEGREQLSTVSAIADGMDNKPKKTQDPVGSWPRNKEAVNEQDVEGRAAGHDMIWMVRPDGMKVQVLRQNIEYGKKQLKFREVN